MTNTTDAPTLAQWLESEERNRKWYEDVSHAARQNEEWCREQAREWANNDTPGMCEHYMQRASFFAKEAEAYERAAAACWRGMESAPEDECEVCWVQPGVGSDDFYADALRSDRAVHDEGTFWCSSGERLSDLVAWRLLPDLPTLARESDDDEEWRREFFAGPQSSAFARDGGG